MGFKMIASSGTVCFVQRIKQSQAPLDNILTLHKQLGTGKLKKMSDISERVCMSFLVAVGFLCCLKGPFKECLHQL